MTNSEVQIERAWDFVWNGLFCEKTNLIYDGRWTREQDGNICLLPTPEEVRAQIPSPCSWNTGMENSGINGGTMLNVIANRYKATGAANLSSFAQKLIEGFRLLTSVSGVRGFLARSVLPQDGKSYYYESSRDQYTHAVYGFCRYMECGLCMKEQKETLTDMLVAFAEYAKKCVTPEKHYQLLRADGGDTMVCGMLHVSPHEWTRLPMFYVAAWRFSGDEQWFDEYKKIRDVCIEKSYGIQKKYWEKPFCLAQMQDSLRILYDYEPDEKYRAKYQDLMNLVASYADCSAKTIAEEAKKTGRKFNSALPNWRDMPMQYLYFWGAPKSGYGYYMPQRPKKYEQDLWDLHNAGTNVILQARCPNRTVDWNIIDALHSIIELVDFEDHRTESPIFLLEAYWEWKALNR